MSTRTKSPGVVQSFTKAVNYLLGAAGRIFSPTDDQYPRVGVQPFEGDPNDEKHS